MDPNIVGTDLSVSQFVALHNQILDYALPEVTVVGELANFRVSKNKWVYFDLKDETATVRFFGTVYQLQGPLEDGMLLRVNGTPKLHPLFGFSITVMSLQPTGEGTIRRAADLLQQKLQAEGLFDAERKRSLPYPPQRIGIITSKESAAYADFMKILNARWSGVEITIIDVQVQGEVAPKQIVAALTTFNQLADPPEVLVLTRGGGSAEDLWAFSSEAVTRAVAASRIPTLVAIGHEVDISLAELAADQRASTPSNAAELLVPDKRDVLAGIKTARTALVQSADRAVVLTRQRFGTQQKQLAQLVGYRLDTLADMLESRRQLLEALSPQAVLRRGYAIVRSQGSTVRSRTAVTAGAPLEITLHDGTIRATVEVKKVKDL
jgi:exodeoxyribonuclease VII large subunit